MWYEAWGKGRFDIPRSFGFLNGLRYYFGLRTRLEKYEKEFKQPSSK